jgi:pSer/pThr/pTyr-binding forkhead associated (FHA) protein
MEESPAVPACVSPSIRRHISGRSTAMVTHSRVVEWYVSKPHGKLYWRDGVWWLEDSGGTNGTFVGEFAQSLKITSPVRLSPGQIFRVGCTRLRLEATDKQVVANVEQAQAMMS